MADEKIRVTELPVKSEITPGGKMLVSQNGIDWQTDVGALMLKANNLSDVDAPKSRGNLNVYSKEEVDDKVSGGGIPDQIQEPDGFKYIGRVPSFAALVSVVPEKAGERVIVSGHVAGNDYGGGVFVARAGSVAINDGGTIMPVNNNFYWQRLVEDPGTLDVTHFGAKRDGVTDCATACLAMWNYTQSLGAGGSMIGIQFPAGEFAVSNIDISANYVGNFRLAGKGVVTTFGYFPATRIKLIGADNQAAFKVQARRSEIANVQIYGQYEVKANTRGFFKNTCVSGQYVHGVNWRSTYTGGPIFDLMDTLDTKFSEFYASYVYGGVIYGVPSMSEQGSWDHLTAIELSNFNVQRCYGKPAFDLQKSGQSFIYNGWIEKTDFPGDLSNGQWIIQGLSMEDCVNPLDLTFTRAQLSQINLQGTSALRYDNPDKSRLLSTYEMGRNRVEAYGAQFFGSLSYDYLSSHYRLSNATDKAAWFNLGKMIVTNQNDASRIRFFGANGQASVPSDQGVFDSNNFGGGECLLTLRRVPGTGTRQDCAIEVHGNSPIADIRISRPYENDVEIYVQLKPQCGFVNVSLETSTNSRFDSGTRFLWNYSGAPVTDDAIAGMTLYSPRKTVAFGTFGAGLTIMEDKTLGFTGRDLIDGKMPFMHNGKVYLMPLVVSPDGSDSFARTGEIDGTKIDNLLGGNLNQGWVNSFKSGADAQNGSLNLSVKAGAAISVNTAIADLVSELTIVSGPANTGTAISTSVDFRKPNGGTGQNTLRIVFAGKVDGKNTIRLAKRVSGVTTTISPQDGFINDGQVLKIYTKGNVIRVYADDVLIWDLTDDQLLTGTYFGFGTASTNAGMIVSKLKFYKA